MEAETTEHWFLWFIEKFSYVPKGRNWLWTPDFPAEGLERTSWRLAVEPVLLQQKRLASLFLQRRRDDAGPETLSVKLEVSIIKVDGSTLYSYECEPTIRKGETRKFKAFVDMDEFFVRRNADFLPRDTLGVRCRMWRGEGSAKKVTQHTARTLIGTENVRFESKIRKFSDLEMNENTIPIQPRSKEGWNFSCHFCISTQDSTDGSIIVDIRSSDFDYRVMKKQISVIGVTGETIKLMDVDRRFKKAGKQQTETSNSFTRKFFLDRRSEFLPNDELTLLYECTLYTGTESSIKTEAQQEIPTATDTSRSCNPTRKE